ncbi:hypothetical protein GCM10027598_78220 [Amycolatopsis oliviviridis]|uniref:Uncharacterized protein n=1 Tax=Amycolatopsis oliviviridis TaxID=1471590 RepID=A0ABQ3L608_9PSEU|nr:hypothetical protein [Amycolatopsis oliviviridis]GHH04851.1 hypothetical protein GCM10017790_08160 [Amycolatopsis oliviviridis]
MTTRRSASAAATRAHQVLAAHAAELADLAVNAVRADTKAGQDTQAAADRPDLIRMAQQILDAAVVAARVDGKTWQEIAGALDGATPQSARNRYWPAVARFRADPFPSQDARREGVPGHTRQTSFRLRRLPAPERQPDTPVESAAAASPPPSGHLALVAIPAERSDTGPATAHTRLKIAERLVAAYERIAANDRQPPQWILDGLAHARRTASELRADIAGRSAE